MGVIRRQGTKQTLLNFFGVFIGAISVIFIYPRDREIYGLARFLIDSSLLLSPIALLGSQFISVKFFPNFRDSKSGHHGFLTFLLEFSVICLGVFLLAYFLFLDKPITTYFSSRGDLLKTYIPYVMPLAVISAFTIFLARYTSNFGRIAVPFIFTNLIRKIILPILIVGYLWQFFNVEGVVIGIFTMFLLGVIGIGIYLYRLGELHFPKINRQKTRELWRQMATYSLFAFAGTVGTGLATRIDIVMVTSLVDLESTGEYGIGLFIANVIAVPIIALGSISGPLISNAWKKGDLSYIAKIYQSSSLILIIFGVLLLLIIVSSIDDLVTILPSDQPMTNLATVVGFLGLGKLVEMSISVNSQIINYSEWYKFNLIATLSLAIFNIVCNYLFIVTLGYGMVGAAVATFSSIILYSFVKYIFIYVKFKLQPFSKSTFQVLLIGILLYFAIDSLNLPISAISRILLRSTIIGFIYLPLVFYLHLSSEYNELIKVTIKKIRSYLP